MDESEATLARADRLLDLVEPATIHRDRLKTSQAGRHLTEGFNRRVMMLEVSVRYAADVAQKADDTPLPVYAIPELAVHVNALWMNLCGALDNLAWAVAHEMSLIEALSEQPGQGRDYIGLSKKPFIDRVAKVDGSFAELLRAGQVWQQELRNLRDPAAHRIPIYPTPGVLRGEAALRAQGMMDQANAALIAGRTSQGLELINRANGLASYEPWIVLSHEGHLERRHLLNQLHADLDQFFALSSKVLNRLFRDVAGYRAI